MSQEITAYPLLKGKLVLITGASSGIGRAASIQFAASGTNLILVSRRISRLNQLKSEINERYPNVDVHVFSLNLKDRHACYDFYQNLPLALRQLDILVNNAGLALGRKTTWETDLHVVDTIIDTNVKGVMHMIKLFVPSFVEANRGHIINVGSIAGKESYAGGCAYSGSKHMLEAINEALRHELVATPIRVSLVSPGMVETEFSLVRYHGDKEKADSVYKGIEPLHPEDVADHIVYIASRPPHVQIADIVSFCTNQASISLIHKKG